MTHTAVAEARFAKGDFRVGSIISRAAAVLWRRCLAFSIVALIAYLPSFVTSITASREMREWALMVRTTQPGEPAAQALNALGWAALSLVALIMFSTLGEAVIAHAAFQDLRRRPVSLAESSNVVFRRLLPILGFAFVAPFLGIVIGALLAAFGLGSRFVGASADYLLIWLGFGLLIIPGLILYTIWFVALPACVVEPLGPWSSLRRSRELTKGHRWKLFGLVLLLIIGGFGSSPLESALTVVAGPIVGFIGRLFWKGLWVSFATVAIAVAYHDLRVVKEGVDVDQVAGVFD